MYQPTKEDLEEMELTTTSFWWHRKIIFWETEIEISYDLEIEKWWCLLFESHDPDDVHIIITQSVQVYPKSKQDIETLIRLLTNN